ncbi:Conserved_hypothetical protein [Hexamita inflata]|uniref:Uncharacterized protein n=1 Tax=Hexamita inflata TaxID=28002 RepID=A0ABP1I7N7_9EUKA
MQEEIQSVIDSTPKIHMYIWSKEMHGKFVVVCMALGITTCRPKQILKFFEHYEGINKEIIGSHLQKERKTIVNDHKLRQSGEIENWMAPNDVQNETLTAIVQKWKEPDFKGFNDEEIMDFVKTL